MHNNIGDRRELMLQQVPHPLVVLDVGWAGSEGRSETHADNAGVLWCPSGVRSSWPPPTLGVIEGAAGENAEQTALLPLGSVHL